MYGFRDGMSLVEREFSTGAIFRSLLFDCSGGPWVHHTFKDSRMKGIMRSKDKEAEWGGDGGGHGGEMEFCMLDWLRVHRGYFRLQTICCVSNGLLINPKPMVSKSPAKRSAREYVRH